MNKKYLFLLILLLIVGLSALVKNTVFVESDKCVGCGDCFAVCPVDAVRLIDGKAVIDAEKCILCEICLQSCTYNAIRKNFK
jgi:NAD-dependent dihydropyrimidine dehydrogenase PreA subunit